MKTLFLMLTLMIAGCGTADDKGEPDSIDPILATILVDYRADAADHGVQLLDRAPHVMRIVDAEAGMPKSDELGACFPDARFNVLVRRPVQQTSSDPDITAEEFDSSWQAAPESLNFKRLVYHELTHCLLGKDHGGDFDDVMHATFFRVPPTHTWGDVVDRLFSADYLDSLPNL